MLQGFSAETVDTNRRIEEHEQSQARTLSLEDDVSDADLYTVTSGRNFAWPFVIEEIKKNPMSGYGKLAMRRPA